MKRLLPGLLALLLTADPAACAPIDPLELKPIERAFHFEGVRVNVLWVPCGMVNAAYFPATGTVFMCKELIGAVEPGAIRFILAHELAHAVIIQRGVAYTGSGEAAADELATLMLIWMGREEDAWAGGEFWWNRGQPENPYDPHLGDIRRAVNIGTLLKGSEDAECCAADYRRAVSSWIRLLDME